MPYTAVYMLLCLTFQFFADFSFFFFGFAAIMPPRSLLFTRHITSRRLIIYLLFIIRCRVFVLIVFRLFADSFTPRRRFSSSLSHAAPSLPRHCFFLRDFTPFIFSLFRIMLAISYFSDAPFISLYYSLLRQRFIFSLYLH